MGKDNCPITIKTPKNWELIISYSKGDSHSGYEKATSILNEYLENMKYENCQLNQKITNHTFHLAPYTILATDFDESADQTPVFNGKST